MHLLPRAAILLALPALLVTSQVSSPKSGSPDPVAHGTPDYGVTQGRVTTHQVKDLGELAARLGSIDTFDRRGDVLWLDDAESSANKWSSSLVGANASFGVSTDRARNGSNSFKLRPGDAIGNTAEMFRYHPYPVLSQVGFESSFSMTGEVRRLDWRLGINDGANAVSSRVRWDGNLSRLEYWDSTGAYVVFATGVSLYFDATLFHTAKLVTDFVTQRYVRFILDSVTYDMDAFIPQVTAIVSSQVLSLQIIEETLAAVPTGTYVDDVILTQNEPANP